MMFKAISSIKVKVELKPVVDNLVFRLHYRYTYTIYMVSMLLCTIYDIIVLKSVPDQPGCGSYVGLRVANSNDLVDQALIHREGVDLPEHPPGDKISCMTGIDSDAYNDVVSNFCFIMGTFTVDRLHGVKIGAEAPHPGVGPQQPGDNVTFHTYYQWVPFVLFIQGVMFYAPHWLWKSREGGLFKQVIQDLSIRDYLGSDLRNYFGREERYAALSKYIYHHMDNHRDWAYSFFFCEFLNLGVVIGTLFLTDWFLGDEFLAYGVKVFGMIGMDPENRTDPMSYVFPRMVKCTFKSFGASGTIQVRDVMCLIATNIINEKIFVFLWVWLVLLTTVTSIYLAYRLLLIFVPYLRRLRLQMLVKTEMKHDVATVMKQASLSDWFLIYNLGMNMEMSVFSEFIHYFARELSNSTDTLPVDEKESMNL